MEHALKQIREHSFLDCFGERPLLVDLGANIGRFSSAFLKEYPGARAILVEGDPYLTDILQRTFAHASQVQLYRGLIGPETKQRAAFHLSKVPEGNSVVSRFSAAWADGETREIQVQMISLGDLLNLAACEWVDLLKVDIEGSEWDVLDGITEALAAQIGQISVEFHDFIDPTLRPRTEASIAKLEGLGFRAHCRGTDRVHGSPYFDCLFYRSD